MNDPTSRQQAAETHVRAFFEGHEVSKHVFKRGPMPTMAPKFRVLEVSPGPRFGLWTYFSNGACDLSRGECGCLEFFIATTSSALPMLEIITMIAHYHHTRTLGLHHTVPIGHPWIFGSACDHLLISKPYPFGPELEICETDESHIHFMWLLPITKAERDFKISEGIEALETQFDEQEIRYWESARPCVLGRTQTIAQDLSL